MSEYLICLKCVGYEENSINTYACTIRADESGECPVLKSNIVFGGVNANKRHWYKAAEALALADRAWLSRLIKRYECLEDFEKALDRRSGDIKVVIQMAKA